MKRTIVLLIALATGMATAAILPFLLKTMIPTTAIPFITQYRSISYSEPLDKFIQSVRNGDANNVAGVYIHDVLALPVGQQPTGNAGYVTREPELLTQFGLPQRYGTVGILAHNDLAGAKFSRIQKSSYIIVVYGDGRQEYFRVREIQRYQALSPTNAYSDFINMEDRSEKLTAGQLFNRIYAVRDRLVLQTCIASEGDPSWGRMFIIATPAPSQMSTFLKQTRLMVERSSQNLVSAVR